MNLRGPDGRLSAMLTDETSGLNLAPFTIGWGAGGYPVWVGNTATGDIAQVVTDLAVLPWSMQH